jgi:hypothetical protein
MAAAAPTALQVFVEHKRYANFISEAENTAELRAKCAWGCGWAAGRVGGVMGQRDAQLP